MVRKGRNPATWLLALVPATALAQGSLPATPLTPQSPTEARSEVGGRAAMDMLRTEASTPALPLRYGRVRAGSERVTLDGRALVRERDYTIDLNAGVVYLKVTTRPGQSVTVEYRYDEATGKEGTFGVASAGTGFQPLALNFRGGNSVVLGLGMTERLADGTVLSSNVYGMRNNFDLGFGKVQGLMMVGDRRKVQALDMLGGARQTGQGIEEGRSHAIVQRLGLRTLGGQLKLDYQDIGTGFAAMQSFQGAGFDDGQVQAMGRERGLKRTSLRAENLGGPSLAFGAGLQTVGDDTGSVTWRDYSAKVAGTELRWSSRSVDPGFTRFAQLREDDREQLARERGLERTNFSAARPMAGGKVQFDSQSVLTQGGQGFYRRSFGLDTPTVKLGYRDQHVNQGFDRFGDLREGDRDQLARERGLVRQTYEIGLAPKGGPSLSYRNETLRTGPGDLAAIDLGFKAGRLTVEHSRRDVAAGFEAMGSLAQPEVAAHLDAVARMYDPAAKHRGEDGHGWGAQRGTDRAGWRLQYDLGGGAAARAQRTDVRQKDGGLQATELALSTPKLTLGYRQQDGDREFDPGRAFHSERLRFGSARGLAKVDVEVGADLGRGRKFEFGQSVMGDGTGDASRRKLSYKDASLALSLVRRSVSPRFDGVGGIVDPERDLFARLLGDEQSEASFAWTLRKGFTVEHRDVRSIDSTARESKAFSRSRVSTSIAPGVTLAFGRSTRREEAEGAARIDQQIDVATFSHDLGRLGKVSLDSEQREFKGSDDKVPDSERKTVAYETKVTKDTTVRTEHGLTRFANGERETLTSHSVAHSLSPRTGVSVTDTRIERDGDKPDETVRDYGFWVDFGKGIRLDYKSNRRMKGEDEGSLNNQVTVSPGQVQGVEVKSMTYQRQGWDDQRDHHVGNVSIGSVKPLRIGFLQDVRFGYTADTVRDRYAWQRENRAFGLGARVGGFAFGFDYRSQINPVGDRAIDRQFTATTDVSGKSKVRAEMRYNLRTLATGDNVMVRDYKLTGELGRGWSLQHQLSTNPLQADGNVLLGDRPGPTRSTKWNVDYAGSKSVKTSFVYEEFVNEENWHTIASTRLALTLFADNPSPLFLEYGMNEGNQSGQTQRSHAFSIRYDQRPGPNQTMSLRFGNLNWERARPGDQRHQAWNLRLDYSLRF